MEPGPKGPGKWACPGGARPCDLLQWSPDQKARESAPGGISPGPSASSFNGARTKRPGKGPTPGATVAVARSFNGARTKRPGKGNPVDRSRPKLLHASMEPGPKGPGKAQANVGADCYFRLQWSPDQKARERGAPGSGCGGAIPRFNGARTKRPGKVGDGSAAVVDLLGFNGARTKRPGKASPLPRGPRTNPRFNGARTKRPGKEAIAKMYADAKKASMEPGPKGPGKDAISLRVRYPDPASMEPGPKGPGKWISRARSGREAMGFNGARTKRPGKVIRGINGDLHVLSFNGARTKRPGKAGAAARGSVRANASMEPGPKGPGKEIGNIGVGHGKTGFNGARTKRPGKAARLSRASAEGGSASMEPGPKGPGKPPEASRETRSSKRLQWSFGGGVEVIHSRRFWRSSLGCGVAGAGRQKGAGEYGGGRAVPAVYGSRKRGAVPALDSSGPGPHSGAGSKRRPPKAGRAPPAVSLSR